MTDSNPNPNTSSPSKERFNFWRFIRLCSLKDFNALKDEQSQAFTEMSSRLTALEEKLDNKTNEIQNSVDVLHQDLSIKQAEAIQKIGEQINGLKIELKSDSAQLQTIVSSITEAIAADFTSIVDKIVSQITAELNQQITASQNSLSSSIEDVADVQESIEERLNDIHAININAQQHVLSACTSVEDCHQQLKQQTKTHIEIENMCAELMQTVRMLVLNTLSSQIEMLLPENTSENVSENTSENTSSKKPHLSLKRKR